MNKYQEYLDMFKQNEPKQENAVYVNPGESFNGYSYEEIVKMHKEYVKNKEGKEKIVYYVQIEKEKDLEQEQKKDKKIQKSQRVTYTRTKITDYMPIEIVRHPNNQNKKEIYDEDILIKIII